MESQFSDSMSFQKVVLIVAIIALILMLSIIGYMMYYTEQSKPYPPTDGSPPCPDGWTQNGTSCKNTISANEKNNVGSFVLEHLYCGLTGATYQNSNCIDDKGLRGYPINGYNGCTGPTYVLGNVTNGLPSTNCYLLASGYMGTASIDISHNMTTLDKNVGWAKKLGITWDGFN